MFTSTTSIYAHPSGRIRGPLGAAVGLEPLERRTLLSGWATVDDYQYVIRGSSQTTQAKAVATDSAGDIYVAGNAGSPTGDHVQVRKSSDHGITWSAPLDDYNVDGFRGTDVSAMAADSTGNLVFTAGSYRDASDNPRWFVRRSQDAGATWSTVDQFSLGGPYSECKGITIDAAGTVYAVGYAIPSGTSSGNGSWVVRRSSDGGTTWSTIDSVGSATAYGVFVHPTAGLFVVGSAGKAWVVRRSLDGGNTWSNVDNFQLDRKLFADGHALGMDAAGNVYAVGNAEVKDGAISWDHWVVRKSTDGGTTWTTADNFQLQRKGSTQASDFAKDSAGNLYVVGGGQVNGSPHWVVRKNPGGTGSWTTDDDFQLAAGKSALAAAVAADSSGHVFAAGSGDSTYSAHWIVRSSTAPIATASTTTAFTTAAATSASLTTGASPAAAAAPTADAQPVQVYAPHTHGVGEASADWWKWALAFSNDDPNPFTDPTGDLAGLDQSGHVFFMPGVAGSGSFSRTIQVPAGKPLLVPLVVTELSTLEGAGTTPTQVRSADKSFANLIDSLHATIDGVPVPDLFAHREVSPTFHFVAAHNNPIGDPEGDSGVAEADGYWLMLAPMSAGTHVIHSSGGVSSFGVTFDVTTTFVVTGKTPGGSTLPMVSAADASPAGAGGSSALGSDDDLRKGRSWNAVELLA